MFKKLLTWHFKNSARNKKGGTTKPFLILKCSLKENRNGEWVEGKIFITHDFHIMWQNKETLKSVFIKPETMSQQFYRKGKPIIHSYNNKTGETFFLQMSKYSILKFEYNVYHFFRFDVRNGILKAEQYRTALQG